MQHLECNHLPDICITDCELVSIDMRNMFNLVGCYVCVYLSTSAHFNTCVCV